MQFVVNSKSVINKQRKSVEVAVVKCLQNAKALFLASSMLC